MSKLFKPFEQGSARFARATGGTGLGLAISRGLADRMGGTIDIQSEVGVGTVVTVAIELEVTKAPRQGKDDISDTQEMAIAALLHDRDIRGDAPLRALVVDDHPVNRMLQSRQLEQLGIDAVVAADGVEALKELGRSHFDLVITDCEMPNMDGFELTSAIRNGDPNYSDMPIVGCTAHALPEVAAQCRECGMDEVLTKPMRLDELAMILRRVVPSAKTPDVPIELQELNGDDPLLNEEQLDQLTGGDRALRGTLMTSFMADHRNTLHELRTALIAGDFDTCRALAHRSKGACGIFGATALSDAFLQLERAASSEPVVRERIANAIDLIANEGERLQQALAAVA